MTEHTNRVEAVAALAAGHGFQVGVAESLTCGLLAADLGAGADASDWFRGSVVAYAAEVKFEVLGVPHGPVVTMDCARQMALGAAHLLDADAVVATTGVGGPEPEEGEPPGTVYVAALVRGEHTGVRLDLPGDPDQVLRETRARALDVLREAIQSSLAGVGTQRPQPLADRPGAGSR
jgi:nicotinamide-nucleotide amidase